MNNFKEYLKPTEFLDFDKTRVLTLWTNTFGF